VPPGHTPTVPPRPSPAGDSPAAPAPETPNAELARPGADPATAAAAQGAPHEREQRPPPIAIGSTVNVVSQSVDADGPHAVVATGTVQRVGISPDELGNYVGLVKGTLQRAVLAEVRIASEEEARRYHQFINGGPHQLAWGSLLEAFHEGRLSDAGLCVPVKHLQVRCPSGCCEYM
jgi:hypothetical protein